MGRDNKDELVAGCNRCGYFGTVWGAERHYLMILVPRRVPSSYSERLVEARYELHVLSRIRQEDSGHLHLRLYIYIYMREIVANIMQWPLSATLPPKSPPGRTARRDIPHTNAADDLAHPAPSPHIAGTREKPPC